MAGIGVRRWAGDRVGFGIGCGVSRIELGSLNLSGFAPNLNFFILI